MVASQRDYGAATKEGIVFFAYEAIAHVCAYMLISPKVIFHKAATRRLNHCADNLDYSPQFFQVQFLQ